MLPAFSFRLVLSVIASSIRQILREKQGEKMEPAEGTYREQGNVRGVRSGLLFIIIN